MRFARYITIGIASGASLWAGLALLGAWSSLPMLGRLIVGWCVLSAVFVGLWNLAKWWICRPIRRAAHGRMTAREFEAMDAAWLDEIGIEA